MKLRDDITTENLDAILADAGITLDPDLELAEEGFDEDDIIEQHKEITNALRLLLISDNLDAKKLQQAMDISRGFA